MGIKGLFVALCIRLIISDFVTPLWVYPSIITNCVSVYSSIYRSLFNSVNLAICEEQQKLSTQESFFNLLNLNLVAQSIANALFCLTQRVYLVQFQVNLDFIQVASLFGTSLIGGATDRVTVASNEDDVA